MGKRFEAQGFPRASISKLLGCTASALAPRSSFRQCEKPKLHYRAPDGPFGPGVTLVFVPKRPVREQFAVGCSHLFCRINRKWCISMIPALFDKSGNRKYLTSRERRAFVYAASKHREDVATFCLTLAFTGARISEVLALTVTRVDAADKAVVFETLKQRKQGVFRTVPIPRTLVPLLTSYAAQRDTRFLGVGTHNGLEAGEVYNARGRHCGMPVQT